MPNLQIDDIGRLRDEAVSALRLLYSMSNPSPPQRLLNMTAEELSKQLEWATSELDRHLMLGLLAALEAQFRRDFQLRCDKRMKDDLSRKFREIHKRRKHRVRFEDDIILAWREHRPALGALLNEVRSSLGLRHWLAHGRSWVPKLGRRFDFGDIERLALTTIAELDFQAF